MTMPFLTYFRSGRRREGRTVPYHLPKARASCTRLRFEQLEDRALLSNWTALGVSDLIADIHAANLAGGSNTILLAPGTTFTLTAVDNPNNGGNGLPVIATGNYLTILGNGGTIARSTAQGTSAFRLFDVAGGAVLTLENLTVANGLAQGAGRTNAYGGAVLNEAGGSLVVSHATFLANQAVGGDGGRQAGGWGIGGAIENQGAATFEYDTFRDNQAIGGATRHGRGSGGFAFGGAIDNGNLGTLIVSNCSFSGNQAIGGFRRDPSNTLDGIGSSGAINNWNTAFVADSSFVGNLAIGGAADQGVDGGYSVAGAIHSGSPFASRTAITIERCDFSRNEAVGGDASPGNIGGCGTGGAVGNGYSQVASTMTIADCSFVSNRAVGGNGAGGWGQGGGLFMETPSAVTIANSTFADNRAVGGSGGGCGMGGAIQNINWSAVDGTGATLMISDSTFTGNQALGGDGGDGRSPDSVGAWSYGQSGAVETTGNTVILRSTFVQNRAAGGTLSPGAAANFNTVCTGGGLTSWGGTLEVRDSNFVGNQVVGCAGADGVPGGNALGGGIEIDSGRLAAIVNCLLADNAAIGGAGGSGAAGGAGVGGGIDVEFVPAATAIGPRTTVTISGTTLHHNRAIGGAGGIGATAGDGVGGGFAVGTGVLFGVVDNSTVILDGGSTIHHNEAIGGVGGLNATGGNGLGGGIAIRAGSATIADSVVSDNQALGGVGFNGGNGMGGGLYNLGIANLIRSSITANNAQAGAASGGLAGSALGGGVYNRGKISLDALTLIFGNEPDDWAA